MDELEAITNRLAATSPRPWRRHGADVHSGDGAMVARGRDGDGETREQADRDADFIAHAPDDIRYLISHIVRLESGAAVLLEAGGEVVGAESDQLLVEGPNSL